MEPVVILGMPRSGSSLVAGIFAKHGCWSGNCIPANELNPTGYYENKDVKDWMTRHHGRLAQTTTMATPGEGFRDYMLQLLDGWEGPWMVKHSAMYFRAWHEFSPTFICVRRSEKGLIESNKATGFMGSQDETVLKQIIAAHNAAMDLSQGVNVFTDALISGEDGSLIDALYSAELEPDTQIIDRMVNPEYWHY